MTGLLWLATVLMVHTAAVSVVVVHLVTRIKKLESAQRRSSEGRWQ